MTESVPHVLIIEDEKEIRRFVRMALQAEGLEVHEADTFHRGLIDAGTRRPDLIVLDLGLPDGDGIDLIRDVRSWSPVPIIVLSARGAESDKILALDTGADDYLVKPFGTGELLARVRALLRRQAKEAENTSVLTFGDVRIDIERRVVERSGAPLHLTPWNTACWFTFARTPIGSSRTCSYSRRYGVPRTPPIPLTFVSSWEVCAKKSKSTLPSRGIW